MNQDLINKYKMDSVLEKYIGRKPELIRIEELLGVLVQRINSGFNKPNQQTGHALNESKENKEIEKLFKKFFGLKDFNLNWIWTPLPDAHTAIKSFQMFDSHYEKDSSGRDYNKRLFIGVHISTGLVTTLRMDNSELMAIILHEIGHSFDRSVLHLMSSLNPLNGKYTKTIFHESLEYSWGKLIPGAVIGDIIGMNKLYTIFKKAIEEVKANPLFRPLVDSFQAYMTIMMAFSTMIPKFLNTKQSVIRALISPIKTVMLYGVEKHADGFAVDYGYGKELASGLNKLDRVKGHPKMNIPVMSWVYDLDDMIHEMILEPLTGYPTMHNRQRSALDRLRMASKDKDLDPRVRKELEKQVKEFEEYYDNYMSLKGNENSKYYYTWLYRKFMDRFAKGKFDIREMVYMMTKDHPMNHDYYREYLKMEKN